MQDIKDGTWLDDGGPLRRAMGKPEPDPETGRMYIQHVTPEDWESGELTSAKVSPVSKFRVLTDEAAETWEG